MKLTNSTGYEFEKHFSTLPVDTREALFSLRNLVVESAQGIDRIDELEECLKWGQHSFVAKPGKIGTTVRISGHSQGASIYFTCTSGLVEHFREMYPDTMEYIGNREILFKSKDDIPLEELKHCITIALSHHIRKKR